MQIQSNPDLFNALVKSLPLEFLEGLSVAIPNIFSEAQSALANSPIIDAQEIPYLFPHMRRAMFETQFRRKAVDAGLNAYVRDTKGGTASFSVVDAKKFVLTASCVSSRGSVVRSADFRSSHAELNQLREQGDFFSDEQLEISADTIGKVDSIYCILLYGGDLGSKNSVWMEFAFPEPDGSGYVDHYSFGDVLVASREFKTRVETKKIKGPLPTFKPGAMPSKKPKDGTTGVGD